jgi:hypothetical protein
MTEISKGHNGNDGRLDGSGFHRSWFPVGLASDIDPRPMRRRKGRFRNSWID